MITFLQDWKDFFSKKIVLRIIFSIIVSALILSILFINLSSLNSKLVYSWADLDYNWLLFALPLIGIIIGTRYLRLKLLISLISPEFSSKDILSLILLGYPLLLLFPGNLGDFMKILFLNRQKKVNLHNNNILIDRKILIGTIAWEKILDLLVITSGAIISGIILINQESLIMSFFLFSGTIITAIFIFLLGKRLSSAKEIPNPISRFIKNPITSIQLIMYTASGWLAVYVIALFLLRAFRISISFSEIALFMPIIVIMAIIPASFGGFGAREFGFVLFFGEEAFFPGLMLSFYLVLIPALIGAPVLMKNSWLFSMNISTKP